MHGRSAVRLSAWTAILLSVLGCLPPLPACGAITVGHYVLHLWQAESGLPQDSVTAVVQTRDGYIWIGTYSALARFDGIRFTTFDATSTPGMRGGRVTSLFEAADGALWIGEEDGALTRFSQGRFEPVKFQAGWPNRSIAYIGADDVDDIWAVSRGGIVTRVRDGLTYVPQPSGTMGLVNVAVQPHRMWISRNNRIWGVQHGELNAIAFESRQVESYIQGMCSDPQQGLWVANNSLLRKWDGAKWAADLGVAPWAEAPLTAMIETRSGLLAAGTQNRGLYLVAPDGEAAHLSRTNGMPSDWITSVVEDHEGNLWVGTRAGLVMLHDTSVRTVSPPDKWQGLPVLSVATGRDGQIWAATEGAGVYRLQEGTWARFGSESGLANLFVWSVSQDARGRIWAGTWGDGIFVLESNRFDRLQGLDPHLSSLAVLHEKDGVSWVGTSAGLLRCQNGRATWCIREPLMSSPDVRGIARDRDGTLWIGMFGGGLGRIKDGQIRQYRHADGLPSDFVQCLHPDTDGALWIGTFGGGLARWKRDHFAVIGRRQGLPSNDIGDVEEDRHGFFWISSHGGILRVRKTDLNRCADGETREVDCRAFGVSDGLPTVECAGGLQPAGCQSADGHLWFPTSEGLATIDPDTVTTNTLPPPVTIEQVLVDDEVAAENPAATASVRVPPGRHRVELRYTGLSYVAPERVRFKYRLQGLDRDWVSAGTKRLADYSYLPPGHYAFQVIACNNDDIWNETGAKIGVIVLPFFWQTTWFRFLAGTSALAAVAGAGWLDARRRMRRKLERLEQQQAVELERARIAHDIHDDLGAYLTRITMLCDPMRQGTQNGRNAEAGLDHIHRTARELTQALDEIVWAVNPRHDTLDSLVDYLFRFAQEFLEHAGLRCRLDVPFQLPASPLSAEARHNLFLAFKEALNNIVRHAGASEVHIQLILEPTRFKLTLADNGRGLSQDGRHNPARPNDVAVVRGNGLQNLSRRMSAIGGSCEVQSRPGQGTTVHFSVPIAPAALNGNGNGHAHKTGQPNKLP